MVSLSTTFWIQFLGVLFGAAMAYFTFVKFKRRELSRPEFLFWAGCWGLLIVIALIPYALDPIIAPLHFYRRLDFFVVLGFFMLLLLGFHNFSATKKMERKLEKYVRQEALHVASSKAEHEPR